MVGEITYSYTPDDWNQERFLALGGFTVVFLNYNKAKFIEKSVASALNQDFPLLEMFFMDDASTDGSGDTMEQLVREYHGRHKLTVVRNTENQHITGQWNIASKLATGNWYGMFCGDDEAYINRVSVIAHHIKRMPTLKGLCTGVEAINAFSGENVRLGNNTEVVSQSAESTIASICLQNPPIIGATAWWHKDLFSVPLPKGPLDDIILRWIIQSKYHGSCERLWLWDGSTATIKYRVGSGISSAGGGFDKQRDSKIESWLGARMTERHFAHVMFETWGALLEYFGLTEADQKYFDVAHFMREYYSYICGTTRTRLLQLPQVLKWLLSGNIERGLRLKFVKECSKRMVQEIFGLRLAAMFSVHVLRRL